MLRSLALLQLAALSHAYISFDTICSIPSTTVNYVSSVDTRGTIDILWFDFSYPTNTHKGLKGKGREDWQSETESLADLLWRGMRADGAK